MSDDAEASKVMPTSVRLLKVLIFGFAIQTGQLLGNPALAQGVEYLRDSNNVLLGKVITRRDGLLEARSAQNNFLGRFDPQTNETRDANNRLIAKGNMLSALINDNVRTSVTPGPEPHRDFSRRSELNQRIPSDNGSVGFPHGHERRAHAAGVVTQSDRHHAAWAFQYAGDNLGKEYFWRNPETGNHGSIIIFPDYMFTDIYLHGERLPCYRGRMTLHVASATDIQRQVICKFSHNNMWMTVQVEMD